MAEHPTAIITGAGSGIGRALAALLAEAGYGVALVGRTRAKLEQTAANLGGETLIIAVDLTEATAPSSVIDQTAEHFGRIDAIANVAGVAPFGPIAQMSDPIWQNCVDVNLSAVVRMTIAVWPIFRRQNGGVIVNVSSMASIDPFEGFGIYAATKAGLNMLTRCTATEGEAIGLRAVAIAPGAVETPMLRAVFDEAALPSDRTLSATEVAAVIRDCITGQRQFEPGEVIVMPSP